MITPKIRLRLPSGRYSNLGISANVVMALAPQITTVTRAARARELMAQCV